jgi:hypothetical protein
MPLSQQQTLLAVTIDTHVKQILAGGGSDEALLMSMTGGIETFTGKMP